MKAFQIWLVARDTATLGEIARALLMEDDDRLACEAFNERLSMSEKIAAALAYFGPAVHGLRPAYLVQTLPLVGVAYLRDLTHLTPEAFRREYLADFSSSPPSTDKLDPVADLVKLAPFPNSGWTSTPSIPPGSEIVSNGVTYRATGEQGSSAPQVFCECEDSTRRVCRPVGGRCRVCGRPVK